MFPINILLVDDHKLFAKSLAVALEEYSEIETLSTAQNIPDLPKLVRDADIVLMDINLGALSGEPGLDLASRLLEEAPGTKIVILTGYDLPVYRHEAKKRGFCGFLNKNISPEELVTALLRVRRGGNCFPRESGEPLLEELTSVEKTILGRISRGEKRRQIARSLYISERTLSNHLQHIFEKLGVSSAVEAVTRAIQLGYIPPLC